MASPKKVFLSHTAEFEDYPPGRSFVDAAMNAVNAAGHQAEDMRNFPARSTSAASVCIERVKEHDIYIGIIGFRYGSPVADRSEVSYTELEFQAATDAGLPRLIFMLDKDAGVTPAFVIDLEYGTRQKLFRERLMHSWLTVRFFKSVDELEAQIQTALQFELGVPRGIRASALTVTWGPCQSGFSGPEFLVFVTGGSQSACTLLLRNESTEDARVTRLQLKTALYRQVMEGETVLGTELLTDSPFRFSGGETDDASEDGEDSGLAWKANGVNSWLIDTPFVLSRNSEIFLPVLGLDYDDDDPAAVSEVRDLIGDQNLGVEYRVTVFADRPPTQATLSAPLRVFAPLSEGGDGGIGLLLEKMALKDEAEKERLRKLYQGERQFDHETRQAIADRLNQIERRKSLDRAERAVAVRPSDPEAHYQLGLALSEIGRKEEALGSLNRTLELGLDNADVRLVRIQALRALSRQDEALTETDSLLQTNIDDARVYEERGRILIDLQRYDEARGAFNSAIRLAPESAAAHYGLGLTLWLSDADEESLAAFDRSLTIDADSPPTHVARASVLATLGRDQDAIEALRNAIVLGFRDLQHLHLCEELLSEDARHDFRGLLDSWGLLQGYDDAGESTGVKLEDFTVRKHP